MHSFLQRSAHNLAPNLFARLRAYNALIRDRNSYLYTTGWIQSNRNSKPVDARGNPVPWMNFPVTQLLNERLTKDLDLFEFGSGFSTYYYASRVKSVTSVEYDERWFNLLRPDVPQNVNLVLQPKDQNGLYCRVIRSLDQQFDVVVVDGRDRVNCLRQAIDCLSARGVILLDDSQRDQYKEAHNFAAASGFRSLSWEGLKPGGNGIDRTTVFYREQNCFGI